MFDRVNVQVQQSGNWQTMTQVNSNSKLVTDAMIQLSFRYPSSRIRAVDASTNRVVDIL